MNLISPTAWKEKEGKRREEKKKNKKKVSWKRLKPKAAIPAEKILENFEPTK